MKKYKISGNIHNVHPLLKGLTLRPLKWNKNWRSYYLKSITVMKYFSNLFFFSNELSVQKFSKFLIDLDCLS